MKTSFHLEAIDLFIDAMLYKKKSRSASAYQPIYHIIAHKHIVISLESVRWVLKALKIYIQWIVILENDETVMRQLMLTSLTVIDKLWSS